MNTKNNQRSRLTRFLLKQAFLSLMSEMPADRISAKDVCTLAGVNRSTFYLHFSNPLDINAELEDDTIALVSGALKNIGAQENSSPEAMEYLHSFLRCVQKNGELFSAFLTGNGNPHFRMRLIEFALAVFGSSFHLDLPAKAGRQVCLFMVSGSIEVLTDWMKSGFALSEDTVCEMLYSLCKGCLSQGKVY